MSNLQKWIMLITWGYRFEIILDKNLIHNHNLDLIEFPQGVLWGKYFGGSQLNWKYWPHSKYKKKKSVDRQINSSVIYFTQFLWKGIELGRIVSETKWWQGLPNCKKPWPQIDYLLWFNVVLPSPGTFANTSSTLFYHLPLPGPSAIYISFILNFMKLSLLTQPVSFLALARQCAFCNLHSTCNLYGSC